VIDNLSRRRKSCRMYPTYRTKNKESSREFHNYL